MTACIAPKPGVRSGLKRADPETRMEDYITGLNFWLGMDSDEIGAIVFADNSGYPLDRLQAAAAANPRPGRPVEFLSFDHPGPPEGLNYGYSEFALVAETFSRSRLLSGHPYFIKATGRYTFTNVPALLRSLPDDFKMAVDSRGKLPFGLRKHPLSTVALAIFSRLFYIQEIVNLHTRMVPAPPWTRMQFIENLLFDAFEPRRREAGILMRWRRNSDPVGVGSNGDRLLSGRKRFQNLIRSVGRRLVPRIWI